ncbi:hypothetical protein BJ912DRAFT_983101 [Pholiota molesta]|nr:hypothetical protein BJ912DRAFT_983101 [Pholiota molesta]
MHRYLLFSGQKLAHSQLLATSLAGLAILTVIFLYLINLSFESEQRLRLQTQTGVKIPTAEDLWETCDIFVISLPNRQDRRRDMERLRIALGLEWIYVDALSADSHFVTVIMDWVRTIRFLLEPAVNTTAPSPNATIHFAWPGNLEALARSTQEIELWSSDKSPWDLSTGFIPPPAYRPIACATNDYTLAVAPLPEHMVLTPARVACWHSHLSAIHRVANNNLPDAPGVAFIFEDDVDMEKDVRQQTQTLWRSLPEDWDIVFLGHCWSDEGRGLPLSPYMLSATAHPVSSNSRLFASTNPKCTHAYALSRIGARRLLLHLQYTPFAYSRAIDQAFAWLVQSHRLKSFSVVPSLVVQRKVTKSDVTVGNGTGSKWKDPLTHGILENIP